MSFFITGATGRVGGKVAKLLNASGHKVLISSRSGQAPSSIAKLPIVKFDWSDPTTFENPFNADGEIASVLMVFQLYYGLEVMKPFIDLAISKGVTRFVVVSASAVEKGQLPQGAIFQYLADIGVDYVVLRPTWFIENFESNFRHSIKANNEVFSVAKDGRIPFVSTDDVAQAAYDVLVAEKSPNTDYFIVGPKLYTYDEAVAVLSDVLGRKITHKRLTNEEEQAIFTSVGLTPEFALFLNGIEEQIGNGAEEKIFKTDKTIVGKQELKDYFVANKQIWSV